MFKTCIYCTRNLGSNDTVENFPVGRRLAFDQEKGRLWVVCDHCRRWNLSPLDERWEAIEECERQFYDTSRSFSTDNIGLAQLSEGLDLVRIGRPKRPEFAAWRYGREFLQRRIRSAISTTVQVVLGIGSAIAGANILPLFIAVRNHRVVARVRDGEGHRLSITHNDLRKAAIHRDAALDGWSLKLSYRPGERTFLLWQQGKGKRQQAVLSGPVAMRAAGQMLPRVNEWGASDAQVRSAVTLIEENRDPERLFEQVAATQAKKRADGALMADPKLLRKIDASARLALEMAAHEESERRALEGELAELQAAWREAEEVASIADRLLIPERVEEIIDGWKKQFRTDGSRG